MTFKASSRQRLRWMQGHFTVARRYFFPLLWQSIKHRSLIKFDMALYGLNVYIVLLTFLMTVAMWIDIAFFGGPNIENIYVQLPAWTGVIAIGLNVATFVLAMILEKVTFKKYICTYCCSRSMRYRGIRLRSMRSSRRTTSNGAIPSIRVSFA